MELTGFKPNWFTFSSVLSACANLVSLEECMEIHQQITRSGFHCNVFLMSAIVDMYIKCGCIEEACQVFDKMHEFFFISWNVMFSSYERHGIFEEAFGFFH